MKQPAAKVYKRDITRIIKRDYKGNENKILEILNVYQDYESYRVWAAILKLSNGDINKVNYYVELANTDYRDVLAPAEYPIYSHKIGFDTDKYSKQEINGIIKDDLDQYKRWFNKK
jgi:hypothetical protein